MKTINDYKVGDIIAKRHLKGILPKAIQYEMKYYTEKVIGVSWLFDWYANHIMLVVEHKGKLQILDAGKNGSGIKDTLEGYVNDPMCRHYTFKEPLDELQTAQFNEIAKAYHENVRPYDKFGLLAQAAWIHTGVWIGPKGEKSREKLYCSELAAILIEMVRPGTFGTRTYKQNIVDIEICDKLILVP